MKTILLVEDDLSLSKSLSKALEKNNYSVIIADNYQDAINKFNQNNIQFIILDIQLPDGNGIDLCKHLRTYTQIPILFLTANNNDDTLIEGLNNGGDDYMTKPFKIKELLARINALLRRISPIQNQIKIGDYLINIERREIIKDESVIVLSPVDFEILKNLILSKNHILTREQLLQIIDKGDQYYVENNTLNVHIKRIREKLGKYNGVSYIETVRGIGYRIHKEVLYGNK